ncbi:MAG: hypothetical protein MUC96_32945 [Myxococcaceae bacterium]|nr:hypothetical protein [Myxococcaceae bacterium]
MTTPTDGDWLARLEVALREPRMDEVEALRAVMPAAEAITGDVTKVARRISVLAARDVPRGVVKADQLGWWLDALLLQRVVHVPRSRNRQLLPVFFGVLAILLGLLLGRIAGATVVLVGVVAWAMLFGGAVQERRGDWLRLGDQIFDLRAVRVERLSDGWTLVEGRRVPTALFDRFQRPGPS